MHFHSDKCNILSITQKKKPVQYTYKLHNHILAKVESAKYLGITLQNKNGPFMAIDKDQPGLWKNMQ